VLLTQIRCFLSSTLHRSLFLALVCLQLVKAYELAPPGRLILPLILIEHRIRRVYVLSDVQTGLRSALARRAESWFQTSFMFAFRRLTAIESVEVRCATENAVNGGRQRLTVYCVVNLAPTPMRI